MVDLHTARTYSTTSFEHFLSWFIDDQKTIPVRQYKALPHEGFSVSTPSLEQITQSSLAHQIIFRENSTEKPVAPPEEIPWEVRDVNGRRISSGKPLTKKPITGPEDPRVDWKKPEEIPELWIGCIITTAAALIAGAILFMGGGVFIPSPASTIGPIGPWGMQNDDYPLQS
jgi:hypothetical protein